MRVDLDHVGHRYADGPLLFHDLTASLMPGHVYALTGPSGAGKSTPVSYTHLTLPTILLV